MTIREYVANQLAQAVEELDAKEISELLEIPPEKAMGDFAFPCFKLAKTLHKAPPMIAAEICGKLQTSDAFESVVTVGPYLNMFLNKEQIATLVRDAFCEGKPFGSSDEGKGKTIVLDYSSINIAKPFHIGHLRTTVIGNAIHKLYRFLGYDTVRINHLGDWGTQFGKLVVAYRKWGSRADVERDGIRGLLSLYVRFHEEAKADPALDDEARATFTALENGDESVRSIWKWFVEISLQEVAKVYELLGVAFDSYNGESFYMDKVGAVVDELKAKQLLEESEGAQIVNLDDADMPPALVLKKDGSTLYTTRDLAAAIYRKKTYDFEKCLYVTAFDQGLHFAQFFKVLEKMGYDWAQNLVHIPYGLVSLEEGKMSTREGNVVFLQDLLDEAIAKTKTIIREKNPSLENLDDVAKMIGVGAVVFNDLFNSRMKDVVFSFDHVLNFDGETGPYVQYTYARASSILRRAEVSTFVPEDFDASCLTDAYAQEVLKVIDTFPARVKEAAERYEPYLVTRFTVQLATAFNKFYQEDPILSAGDEKVRRARIALTKMTTVVLKDSLALIGVAAPERM